VTALEFGASISYNADMTSIDLTLNLPDELAAQAEAAGLLSPRELARLLRAEIKRKAAAELVAGANRAAAAGSKPMSLREIQKIVDEVRSERRAGRT
jgi:hypothetical protein